MTSYTRSDLMMPFSEMRQTSKNSVCARDLLLDENQNKNVTWLIDDAQTNQVNPGNLRIFIYILQVMRLAFCVTFKHVKANSFLQAWLFPAGMPRTLVLNQAWAPDGCQMARSQTRDHKCTEGEIEVTKANGNAVTRPTATHTESWFNYQNILYPLPLSQSALEVLTN